MNQIEDTTPKFTREHLLALFACSFGYPPEASEIQEIFPEPPHDSPLPATITAILGIVNDEKCDFRPTAAWYDELTLATCPLAVHVLRQLTPAEVHVIEMFNSYSARLYLHEVQVPAEYGEIGPWKILVIDVGRGAPLSYLA